MKPFRCNLLGKRYKVHYQEEREDERLDGASGFCDRHRLEIGILKSQAEDQQRETFLHEVLHVVDSETAPPVKRLDESDVVRLSVGLFAVLRANPEMAEWMFLEDDRV